MKLLKYLKEHIEKNNIGLIIISHYPEEIEFLCDNVIFLEKGHFIAQHTVNDFLKNFKEEGYDYA